MSPTRSWTSSRSASASLGALKAKLQILVDNEVSRRFFAHRGYLLETDCEPWGKELVEGGAPPCR